MKEIECSSISENSRSIDFYLEEIVEEFDKKFQHPVEPTLMTENKQDVLEYFKQALTKAVEESEKRGLEKSQEVLDEMMNVAKEEERRKLSHYLEHKCHCASEFDEDAKCDCGLVETLTPKQLQD